MSLRSSPLFPPKICTLCDTSARESRSTRISGYDGDVRWHLRRVPSVLTLYHLWDAPVVEPKVRLPPARRTTPCYAPSDVQDTRRNRLTVAHATSLLASWRLRWWRT